jgi:outer membrane immunogenic protein
MIAPIYNWNGFYIGANGGWGQSRNCWGWHRSGSWRIVEGVRMAGVPEG